MFDKLDINGIPNREIIDNSREERFILANEQEQFVVEKLRIAYVDVEWYTTTEYMGVMNPEQNRILGDIVGIRKNKGNMKPDIFINLKVTAFGIPEYYVGNIILDSILGFAYKQNNHYYMLSNSNGSDWIIVSCRDVYNLLMNKTTKCLIETKFKRYDDPKYDRFKFKFIKKQFPGVSRNDFIPGNILRKYNKRKTTKER